MVKRCLLGLLLAAGTILGRGWAGELAQELPASTVFYLKLDVEAILTQGERFVRLVDPALGESVRAQCREIQSCLKDWATSQETDPALVDRLTKTQAYLVVLRRTESLVSACDPRNGSPPLRNVPEASAQAKTRPAAEENPVVGGDAMEQEPGAAEPATSESRYSTSLVIATEPDVAADCLKEITAYFDRGKAKDPGNAACEYESLPGEPGVLIRIPDTNAVMGCIGRYIVASTDKPVDLWNTLRAQPRPNLAGEALFQRYDRRDVLDNFRVLVNLAHLVRQIEGVLGQNLEEAKREALAVVQPASGEQLAPVPSAALAQARRLNSLFQFFKETFSLDRLGLAGISSGFIVEEGSVLSDFRMSLEVNPPVGPALQNLLDGGARFQAPKFDAREKIALMGRLGAQKVYDAVVQALDAESGQVFQIAMLAMKIRTGHDLGDIVSQLAGDFYLFVDVAEGASGGSELPSSSSGEITRSPQGPVFPFTIVFGLADPGVFAPLFSDLATRLSQEKKLERYWIKRSYEGTDIYLAGKDVSDPQAEPDGIASFAVVHAGRYLCVGGWNDVTDFLRRTRTAEERGEMAAEVEPAPGGQEDNLRCIVPRTFLLRLQALREKTGQEAAHREMLRRISGIKLPGGDPALDGRLQAALAGLYDDWILLREKSRPMLRDVVFHGRFDGACYEIQSRNVLSKD
ncbi:MAG: hypothetical protein V1918_01575 [Planctomycetota bacterium]